VKDPEELTSQELDSEISNLYQEVMQMNSEAISAIRIQMQNATAIRDFYLLQADRMLDIIHMYAAGAAMIASSSGDLLLNEYGLQRVNPEEEEDDEEEE
jgi:hypothetical protein